MESSLLGISDLTPEKVAIMKLEAQGDFENSFLDEPFTPSSKRKSFGYAGGSSSASKSALTTRTSRHVSSAASRRSASFMNSHRNKMSMELTTQAENKFLSLMELMSGASREAASLKDYWSRLISERESSARERDDLLLQIDEVTETLQETQEQHHDHGYELVERKKEVDKLRIELTAALTAISEHRKKVTDRDHELDRARQELSDFRLSISRSTMESETLKSELESFRLRIHSIEEERDHARESSDKYHGELRTTIREHTEMKSKNSDLISRLESTRKEVLSLTDRIKIWEMEREEYLHEKDHLQEELRRVKARIEDTTRELAEYTEKYEKSQREVTKLRESLRIMESERDEYAHTIEILRRDLKVKTGALDDSETRYADVLLKYEHIKREVVTIKEKLRDVESENTEYRLSVERKQEEHRLVVIERDQLKDDLELERHKSHERSRELITLQELLTRTQSTVTEVRSEVINLTERIKLIERERDDFRDKNGHHTAEITSLKERIILFQAEVRTVTEARDRLRKEMHEYKSKYEEVTETITEVQDGSGELEFEIESLRTMLRETREQKERAISARNSAERERDEFLAKYEEKCREMERYEEESSRLFHMHARSSGGGETRTSSTRVISRNGTSSSKRESAGHHLHHDG